MIQRKWLFVVVAASAIVVCDCDKQSPPIDPVASLYSNTQVIPNIEYAKIDSESLLLDVYVPAKRLGEPPWVEYSDDKKPTLLFLHGGG